MGGDIFWDAPLDADQAVCVPCVYQFSLVRSSTEKSDMSISIAKGQECAAPAVFHG